MIIKNIIFILFVSITSIHSIGQVLIINGTSNSGKTTIAKALQSQLGSSWKLFCVDDFIWQEMAKRVEEKKQNLKILKTDSAQIAEEIEKTDQDWSFTPQEWKSFIEKTERKMYQEILEPAQKDDVICDIVLQKDEDFQRAMDGLNGVNIIWGLVYCSLTVLPERAKARAGKDLSENSRPLFWALEQFGNIYKVSTDENSCIDTIDRKSFKKAIDEAKEYDFMLNLSWYNYNGKRFDNLINELNLKLELNLHENVFFIPEFDYHFRINNSSNSVAESVKQVKFFLEKRVEA